MKLTTKELKVLQELRGHWESEIESGWGMVYLDNCSSSNDKGFSGILGSLKKKGLYRSYDNEDAGIFGQVKLERKSK